MTQLTPRVKTYTKRDIVKLVAEMTGHNLVECSHWIDCTFDALRETMLTADPELRIEIRDFGVFEIKQTKSKPKARNPRSGELIYVPPRRKSHFRPGKLLKIFLSRPLDGKAAGPPSVRS